MYATVAAAAAAVAAAGALRELTKKTLLKKRYTHVLTTGTHTYASQASEKNTHVIIKCPLHESNTWYVLHTGGESLCITFDDRVICSSCASRSVNDRCRVIETATTRPCTVQYVQICYTVSICCV